MARAAETGWAEHALGAAAGGRAAPRRRQEGGGRDPRPPRLRGHRAGDRRRAAPPQRCRRPGQRLPGARPARGAGAGAAVRGLPRDRQLRAGGSRRPPPPSRDLPPLRPHGALRGPRPGAGDPPDRGPTSRSRSPSTTSSSAGSAAAARTEPARLRGGCEPGALLRAHHRGRQQAAEPSLRVAQAGVVAGGEELGELLVLAGDLAGPEDGGDRGQQVGRLERPWSAPAPHPRLGSPARRGRSGPAAAAGGTRRRRGSPRRDPCAPRRGS